MDHIDAVVFGLVVPLNIVLYGIADANHAIALGHDCTVFADAVEAVHGGDEWALELFVGKPGQPCRDAAVGVDERGAESVEPGAEGADAIGEGEGILGADIEGDVPPSVFFNLIRQLPPVGNDGGLVSQPDEFAVKAEDDGFNPALV